MLNVVLQFPEIVAFIMRRFKGKDDVEKTHEFVRKVRYLAALYISWHWLSRFFYLCFQRKDLFWRHFAHAQFQLKSVQKSFWIIFLQIVRIVHCEGTKERCYLFHSVHLDCNQECIGQTKLQFRMRLKEHEKAACLFTKKGKFLFVTCVTVACVSACVTNHEIAWENFQIIATNPRYHQICCLEAQPINSAHALICILIIYSMTA